VRVFPFSHQNSIFGNGLADCNILSTAARGCAPADDGPGLWNVTASR